MKDRLSFFFISWRHSFLRLITKPLIGFSIIFFFVCTGIPFIFPHTDISTEAFTFDRYISRFTFFIIFLFPVLTMNMEKKNKNSQNSGCIHCMVTGKFFALFVLYVCILIVTLPILFILPSSEIGIVISAYILLVFYGSASLSIGQCISSLFSKRIITYVLTFILLLFVNLVHFIPLMISLPDWIIFFFNHISFAWHFESGLRGIIDSRDILFYTLCTVMPLLITAHHESKGKSVREK